jgi:hypothetical protein
VSRKPFSNARFQLMLPTKGSALKRKYNLAIPERNRHTEAHRGFTATLPPEDVAEWTKVAELWDEDRGYPKMAENPFEVVGIGAFQTNACWTTPDVLADVTEAMVQRELGDEEGRRTSSGPPVYPISASSFIVAGLDLESAQWVTLCIQRGIRC